MHITITTKREYSNIIMLNIVNISNDQIQNRNKVVITVVRNSSLISKLKKTKGVYKVYSMLST